MSHSNAANSFQEAHCDNMLPMQWSRLIKLMVLGAVGFWLPDVLLHAWRGNNFSGRDVLIATVLSPLMLLITFLFVKRKDKATPQKQVAPWLLAGVWLFGGFFMLLGASFSSGGFTSLSASESVKTLLLSVIPIYTFMMATYDGALGALLLATAVILFVWLFQWRDTVLRSSR
jgi:hypothetical protein